MFKINNVTKVTTNTDTKFKTKPALIISSIFTLPLPNTTALGGVAIGSIKAQLAAIVVGITKIYGFTSKPTAKIISIGVKVATVAVLEFSSVSSIIKATDIKINK